MIYFSQTDPRWASQLIGGNQGYTIARWGCAYTSLVNLWSALTGKTLTTKRFIEIATNPKNFTDKKHALGPALILWDRVCAELGGIKYVKSEDGYRRANISLAIKSKDGAVMLWVNKKTHFIAGWNVVENDIRALDPLGGKLVGALAKYHTISGARYFIKA